MTTLPTVAFLGADGAEVGRIVGFAPAGPWMERAASFTGQRPPGEAPPRGGARRLLLVGLVLLAALVAVALKLWPRASVE